MRIKVNFDRQAARKALRDIGTLLVVAAVYVWLINPAASPCGGIALAILGLFAIVWGCIELKPIGGDSGSIDNET